MNSLELISLKCIMSKHQGYYLVVEDLRIQNFFQSNLIINKYQTLQRRHLIKS